jgi:type IV pilus assembly protein PilA
MAGAGETEIEVTNTMRREHTGARVAHPDEAGFTLIELMVVILIIAILIAMAVPQFLAARTRADDRATQSDLRNGMTAEKTVYVDTQQYYLNSVAVKAAEPSLQWGTKLLVQVGMNSVSDDTVCLSEQSASGTWFGVGDIATSSATAPAGTYFTKAPADPCTTVPSTIAGWALTW